MKQKKWFKKHEYRAHKNKCCLNLNSSMVLGDKPGHCRAILSHGMLCLFWFDQNFVTKMCTCNNDRNHEKTKTG